MTPESEVSEGSHFAYRQLNRGSSLAGRPAHPQQVLLDSCKVTCTSSWKRTNEDPGCAVLTGKTWSQFNVLPSPIEFDRGCLHLSNKIVDQQIESTSAQGLTHVVNQGTDVPYPDQLIKWSLQPRCSADETIRQVAILANESSTMAGR